VNGRSVLIGIAQGIIENENEKMNYQNAGVCLLEFPYILIGLNLLF
jgi:hypothetical protein